MGSFLLVYPSFRTGFVLYFESLEVTNSKPLFDIIHLNPVMNISLNVIIPTIQKSMIPMKANEKKADNTRILSANGSRNLPWEVI